MTSSNSFRRFAFAYGIAFAAIYVLALKLDIALFTVYPSIGVVLLGTHHARDITGPPMPFLAPAMYWYGWTATAALGALIFGLIGALMVLAGLVVGGSRGRNDGVRLPHDTLVSPIARPGQCQGRHVLPVADG